jgi:competence protein ComEC
MAVLAVTAFAAGRPASGVRLLSLCVAGLLLIDPLLAHSVGWWMSVGATAGIVLGARPLADALPGPRWLAAAISVSATAQLGVAPVSVAAFGGVPAASLPANLLAGPAAAPVMVWGLPAGVLAGLVPAPVAFALHLPTRLCVWWLAFVARLAARLPLGRLRAAHLVALTVAAGLMVVAHRRRVAGEPAARGSLALGAGALAAMAFVSAALAAPVQAAPGQGLAVPGGRLWRDTGASVLVVESSDADLIAALREAELGQLDILVVTSGHVRDQVTLDAVVRRHQPRLVLAPAGSRVEGARVASVGTAVTAGSLVVDVVALDPLEVTVGPA